MLPGLPHFFLYSSVFTEVEEWQKRGRPVDTYHVTWTQGGRSRCSSILASFPGPTQLSVTCGTEKQGVLKAPESWAGPGKEASCISLLQVHFTYAILNTKSIHLCFYLQAPLGDDMLVMLLCQWAVTPNRAGEHRPLVAARVLLQRQTEVLKVRYAKLVTSIGLPLSAAKTFGLLQPHFRLSELHQCDQRMLLNRFS